MNERLQPYTQEIRAHFPQLTSSGDIFLDNAATSLKPRSVIDAVSEHMAYFASNVRRGVHSGGARASELVEDVRCKAAESICALPSEIIFTSNASHGIELVAQTLRTLADKVCVSVAEHHSNLLPWLMRYRPEYLPIDSAGRVQVDAEAFHQATESTVVTIAHVSNVFGSIQPLSDISAVCERRGALLVVDGTQGFPHLEVDVRALGIAAYIFSSHKAYGPSGVGIVFLRHDLMQRLKSPFFGGGTVRNVHAHGEAQQLDGPHSFELGTPNIEGIIGTGAALDFRRRIDKAALKSGGQAIRTAWAHEADKLKHFRILGSVSADVDHVGLITLGSTSLDPDRFAAVLSDRFRVHVRSGLLCAQPTFERAALPRGGIRLSAAVYNTPEECAKAMSLIKLLDA